MCVWEFPRAQLAILRQPVAQAVEALGDFLARKIRHRLGAFIHFDARNDPLLLQHFDESATVASFLSNRFVKKNHAADKLSRSLRRKQNFPIRATVFLRRRNIDAFQSLLDRARTFIGCQDSLARGDQFFCYRFQIFASHVSLL